MESKNLKVTYHRAKDTLYLRTLPKRPATMDVTDYGFYIRYDWDNPDEIVGFEWLGFSAYINTLDEPGVIPDLEMRFDIEGTDLKGLTLKEVLRWAYHRYVLCDLSAELPEVREVATEAAEI